MGTYDDTKYFLSLKRENSQIRKRPVGPHTSERERESHGHFRRNLDQFEVGLILRQGIYNSTMYVKGKVYSL